MKPTSGNGGGGEGIVDGNVSVPEVTLFYSCRATSGLAQTPCAEYGQFPYAKRHSDVEQSGIARIRRVLWFGRYDLTAEQIRFQ